MLLSSIFIRSTAMQQSRGSIFIFTRVEDIVRTGEKHIEMFIVPIRF